MNKIQEMLDYFKEEYDIDTQGQDIDDILGIKDLKLSQVVWEPYIEKTEIYLKNQLKDFLIEKQKNITNGQIIAEAIFRKYENYYIIITPAKENINNETIDNAPKIYTHIILSFYDIENGTIEHIKRKYIRVSQYNGKFFYNKIKLSINKLPDIIKDKFNNMGLFSNRTKRVQQQIYISRLLTAIYFINNNLVLKPNYQGHHTYFDTQFEMNGITAMLLIRKDKHTEIFHPNNIKGSNNTPKTIALGMMFNFWLQRKYFITKEKKFNADIRFNIPDILMYYFVEYKSISEVQRMLKTKNPKRALAYNTIKKIVTHFTQYTPVLTLQNIDYIRDIEK